MIMLLEIYFNVKNFIYSSKVYLKLFSMYIKL